MIQWYESLDKYPVWVGTEASKLVEMGDHSLISPER